nr:zinc finger, GRF-type [Tanacetum cinerariifolium]
MSCTEELANAAKSNKIKDQMLVLMGRQVETELKLKEKFRELCEEVSTVVKEREDVIEELEILSGNYVSKETTSLLRRGQNHDLDKMTRLQIMVNQSHLGVREKLIFGFNYGFFAWFDPPLCDKAVDVIPSLLKVRNQLKEHLEEKCVLLREKDKLVQALVVAWMYVNPLIDVYDGNENGVLIV